MGINDPEENGTGRIVHQIAFFARGLIACRR